MRLHRTNIFLTLGSGTRTLIFGDRQTRILGGKLHETFGARTTHPLLIHKPVAASIRGAGTQSGRHRLELLHEGLPPILVDRSSRPLGTLGRDLEQALSPTGRWAIRNLLIGGLRPDLQPLARAFAMFDNATDWTGLNDPARSAMQNATVLLLNGVIRRADWAGLGMTPPPGLPDTGLPNLTAVEGAFRSALQVFHRPTATDFDLAFFTEAFAGFVCSEFALRDLTGFGPGFPQPVLKFAGVPDSSLFLCFAEAAFAFLAAGLNTKFWGPLLPSFVAGARSFGSWYWDHTTRTRHAYSVGPLAAPMDRSGQLALVESFRQLTIAELERTFGDAARAALLEELVGTVPDAGPPARHSIDVQYQLLRRITPTAVTSTSSTPTAGPIPVLADSIDSGQFALATHPREHALLTAIRSIDPAPRIPLCNDPVQQEAALLRHLNAVFAGKTFADPLAPALKFQVKLCKGVPSVWNPATKQCDPPDAGAALRLKVVRHTPSYNPCSTTDADSNARDTEWELLAKTANAKG